MITLVAGIIAVLIAPIWLIVLTVILLIIYR